MPKWKMLNEQKVLFFQLYLLCANSKIIGSEI